MEQMFTKKEVAELLKVSERTVDRLIKEAGLAVFRVGRQLRYPESSINEIMTKEQLSPSERNKLLHSLIGD